MMQLGLLDTCTTHDLASLAHASGLFGAGVYFAESVSKADEYVKGKVMGSALVGLGGSWLFH